MGSGRVSEFNSEHVNSDYPRGWLEELRSMVTITNNLLPISAWNVVIHIAKQDAVDSASEQYELIVDECDYIAQQLVKKYNQDIQMSERVTISGISRIPFYKRHTVPLTGVILSFALSVPDITNLC